ATPGLLGAALVATLFLGRLVELGLRLIARGRLGRVLSCPSAPAVAVGLLLLARGLAVAALPAWWLAPRLLRRVERRSPNLRLASHAVLIGMLFALAAVTGH